MANVKISELHPIGFELFSDSESYMKELSEAELNAFNINGGGNENITVVNLPSIPITFPCPNNGSAPPSVVLTNTQSNCFI